jgi:hypothetical protein
MWECVGVVGESGGMGECGGMRECRVVEVAEIAAVVIAVVLVVIVTANNSGCGEFLSHPSYQGVLHILAVLPAQRNGAQEFLYPGPNCCLSGI